MNRTLVVVAVLWLIGAFAFAAVLRTDASEDLEHSKRRLRASANAAMPDLESSMRTADAAQANFERATRNAAVLAGLGVVGSVGFLWAARRSKTPR